jgi:hypothetical protein
MARSSIVPSPVGQDWRSWANLLVTYLNDAQSTEVINPPRPVALGHKLPNRVQSAVSPGVLMFDVTDMAPVYSDGVDWLLMLSEDRGNEIYVRKSGGTMTGPLVVDNEVRAFRTGTAAQYASITGGDASGPRVDFSGAAGNPKGGLFNLLGDTTGLFHFLNGGVEFARVEPGSSPATNGTLLNRAMGDARYLNLTGGTLTDDLIVSGTSPAVFIHETDGPANQRRWMIESYGAGATFAISPCNDATASQGGGIRLDRSGASGLSDIRLEANLNAAALPAPSSAVTRQRGDARYSLSSSDRRLKQNIEDMPSMLDSIAALLPVTFEWVPNPDDPRRPGPQMGLIAQDVAAVLPSAVYGDAVKSIDALSMIGAMVKAIQELRAEVIELKGVINAAAIPDTDDSGVQQPAAPDEPEAANPLGDSEPVVPDQLQSPDQRD